jgi:hypothetical protein
MSQPFLSDTEVKGLGEGRWDAKYGKRFFVLMVAVLLIGYGVAKLAQLFPQTPIGLALAFAIGIGFIFVYRKWIHIPKSKAGEEFLKEWRS